MTLKSQIPNAWTLLHVHRYDLTVSASQNTSQLSISLISPALIFPQSQSVLESNQLHPSLYMPCSLRLMQIEGPDSRHPLITIQWLIDLIDYPSIRLVMQQTHLEMCHQRRSCQRFWSSERADGQAMKETWRKSLLLLILVSQEHIEHPN